METVQCSLCLSDSHRERPLLFISEIEALQLFVDVVFEIVLESFEVVFGPDFRLCCGCYHIPSIPIPIRTPFSILHLHF